MSSITGGSGVITEETGSANQVAVFDGTTTLTGKTLTNGQLLIGSTGASPVAAAITAGTNIAVTNGAGSATVGITGTIAVANGGTNSATALNNNRVIVSSAGAVVEAAAMTNGQLLIGSTGAAPVVASLTAGTNITITPAAGSITIASSGGGYSTIEDDGVAQTARTTIDFVGMSVIADDLGSETRVRINDLRTMHYVKEDFSVGVMSFGTIGELGWANFLSGTGAGDFIASTANRPGLVQLSTGATSSSVSALYCYNIANQNLLPADTFDSFWYFKINQTGTGQIARVGWVDDVTSNPPTDGIYLEKLSADTTWFLVTRAAGVQTRVDTTAAESTAYLRVRLRRVNGTTIGATVDAGTEVTSTTNIPTVALNHTFSIRNSAAANKVMVADAFEWLTTGLSR